MSVQQPSHSRVSRSPLHMAILSCMGVAALPTIAQEGAVLEEIVVTAQRKAESIQDVPIAVSAFSGDDMELRRLDDARDLQTAVPNLNYTGTGVAGGEGFQIRGVGNAVGGTTGDVGVGIHHNNAPQVQSRIAAAEAFDVERVEILRGPQGTLYGRNATGGVINYITAKPQFDTVSATVSTEFASYDSKKVRGMVNIPLGEDYAFRLAANWLNRDGYTENVTTGNDIDDRDLWSARATFAFQPTDWLDGWVLYEKFEENDSRSAGARSLCISDPGPTQVGDTPVPGPFVQAFLSQGCVGGSIYDRSAYSHPNSVGTFGGRFAQLLTLKALDPGNPNPPPQVLPFSGDLYAGQSQPYDLRKTAAFMDPSLDVEHDIVELEVNIALTEELTMSLLGHSSEDSSYRMDGSYEGSIGFLDTAVTPGGVFTDPQSGAATSIRTLNIFDFHTEQQSWELRLQSDFAGPLNFNLGYLSFDVERDQHTWVSTNATSLYLTADDAGWCATVVDGLPLPPGCVYFDNNPVPDYSGHQYFDTWTPYQLDSQALFGEVYADLSDTLKLTAGLRYTDDQKERTAYSVQLLSPLGAGGIGTGGYPESAIRDDEVEFQEYTGRVVLDWMPDTSFSESTLVYASYSRGYKSGGFNSPEKEGIDTFQPYKPEFVNAYEIGTKNQFTAARAQVNASLFYYDYQDYQISKIEGFSARNENIDATVWGLELEASFEPLDRLRVGANLGWLKTEIESGESIDPLDRTAGNPDYMVLKDYDSGCIAPVALVESLVQQVAADVYPPSLFFNPCSGGNLGSLPSGIAQDLGGNELPNAPELSASLLLQYGWQMGAWDSSFLFDYSWKDDSYASVFNGENYELRSWENANASLNFSNLGLGVDVQVFVKNIFDDDTIVNYGTGSDGVGLVRNISLLDPRIYGVNLRYHF
ncbi:TonB-dependent receptor [Gilvimarinus sp. F26214L]|uniref:TonB-dependent receptor n=1 Tax=Gilvimarinus sp. DZF01 TaxID=3461371 RepID=UPI0040453DEA